MQSWQFSGSNELINSFSGSNPYCGRLVRAGTKGRRSGDVGLDGIP
jgi:hypothetical protein